MSQNKLQEPLSKGCRRIFETAKKLFGERVSPIGRGAEQKVNAAADNLRKRWEESEYDAADPIHRMRGQALVWLFSMRRRCRLAGSPLHSYAIPIVAAFSSVVLGVLLASHLGLASLQFLLAAVIISVRAAGLRAGIIATSVCLILATVVMSGAIRTHAGDLFLTLLTFLSVATLTCILVDSLEMARQEAHRERAEAEAAARRYRFLAEATAMLDAEFSAEAMLSAVTRAIVPAFASWATADLFHNTRFRRIALSHEDATLSMLLRSAQRDLCLSMPTGHPLYEALLAREARIFPNAGPELLGPLALGETTISALTPAHLMFVPLTARNRLLGSISLISTNPDRPFSLADLAASRDLGLRVGMALDNLRLYRGALDEAAELAEREREAADRKNLLEQERVELVEQNARLTVEAATDGLTGLLNHLTFQRALEEEYRTARRDRSPLSVALLDVDNFKLYNDTFGHPAGDEVLKRLATILTESSRSRDTVARYGGEEFVIVMPHTDAAQSLEAVERIRQAVESAKWPDRPITASFGVATVLAAGLTPRELVAAADGALYRSKQAGRNRVTQADSITEAVVFDHGFRVWEGIAQ